MRAKWIVCNRLRVTSEWFYIICGKTDFLSGAILIIHNVYLKMHSALHWVLSVVSVQAFHGYGPSRNALAREPLLPSVFPGTILGEWKQVVARYWTASSKRKRKPGRPPITKAIRELIRDIKNDNFLWGVYCIQDELRKINIDISRETIRKVLADYLANGEIKPNLSWATFLNAHWDSLFACDFFTVDMFGFSCLYVFFILELKSRKIVHWNITTNPNIQFLRNQFSYFSEIYPSSFLIHDNSGELKWFPYSEYGIMGVATVRWSCPRTSRVYRERSAFW